MIEVNRLEFNYPRGGFRLRVEELRIAEGERVAITGPSGLGKTTLLHLIAGILEPESGSIRVSGIELAGLPAGERQDLRLLKLGLVFQELELLEHLDLLDNVLLPFRLTHFLQIGQGEKERARHLLTEMGLGGKVRRFPGQLSQGERQRVALARALVTGPALILCDEPTGNLDAETRDRVSELLFGYASSSGSTLLVVTHDPELEGSFERSVDIREFT